MNKAVNDMLKVQAPANSSDNGTFQKDWFCAARAPSGEIHKLDTDTPAGFLPVLADSPIAWVDYRTDDFEKDAVVAALQCGFTQALVSSLLGDHRSNYQDFDVEMGMRIPSIQVDKQEVTTIPLLLLLKKNFVLTIHPVSMDKRFFRLRRYSDTVLKKIPVDACAEDKLTLLLMRIIDENNERNFEHLRDVEELGDLLNKDLMDPTTSRVDLGSKIYHMKHDLITYLDALWETVDVLHALRYGDAEIITNDNKLLEKMTILTEDVNRQIALAEHMSEVLASGLEVLQSIYNNQLQVLNNRLALTMTYLTILGTAVLVPNTLATIFGNSAFNMGPQDIWWYTALLVISTVVGTIGAWWWVKKMGWMPKRPD